MNRSLKPSILSAAVLAFASFGDSFLYTILPVNALQMNVPVVWIGFLLSINRFVRLVANHLFAGLFNKLGFKRITIFAAVFSVLTTFSYGIASNITVWITARIIWGFCFSALRISSISYSLDNKRRGLSLGLNKGLQEVGPVISLIVGPVLLKWTNLQTTFFIFSFTSLAAVVIAFYLPELKHIPYSQSISYNIIPSSFNLLTFLSSFFVQGILIVTISGLLMQQSISIIALTTISGFYLAYRRICAIFLSPLGGIFADKFGIDKVYLASLFITVTGLFLIATGFTKIGIIITFTFYTISNSLSPGNAVAGAANQLRAVAENSTWSDIGAAAGALIAGILLQSAYLISIFYLAAVVLSVAWIYHIRKINFQAKYLLKWK